MIHAFLTRRSTIHLFVALSLLALWGALATGNTALYLLAALSGYGSLCSAFSYTIRRIDR